MTTKNHNTTLVDLSGKPIDEAIRLLKNARTGSTTIAPDGVTGAQPKVFIGEMSQVQLVTTLHSPTAPLFSEDAEEGLKRAQAITIEAAKTGNGLARKLRETPMTPEELKAALASSASPKVAGYVFSRAHRPEVTHAVGGKNVRIGGILPENQRIPSIAKEELGQCQLNQLENFETRLRLRVSYRDWRDVDLTRSQKPTLRERTLIVPLDFPNLLELGFGVALGAEAAITCSYYVDSSSFHGATAREKYVLESFTLAPIAQEQLHLWIQSRPPSNDAT